MLLSMDKEMMGNVLIVNNGDLIEIYFTYSK